jgi:chemotaxis protein histidine kinase CheA
MNYLDLLDSKPVALPKKTINIQLQPTGSKGLAKTLSVKMVDVRAEKEGTIDRDQLKSIFQRQRISKTTEVPAEEPIIQEPPVKETVPTKAVKLPERLSIIPEEEKETEPFIDNDAQIRTQQDEPIFTPAPIAEKERMVVKKRVPKKTYVEEQYALPHSTKIGDATLKQRLIAREPPINIKSSHYYLNNREIFVNFVNRLFAPYKQELSNDESDITCENIGKGSGEFSLLTHQKIVRDYLNLYTPYRGLLLYHGLGSGKTCTSIGIAEGMKTMRNVIIMTPASLRTNYIEQLKQCGDYLYRRNQFWEWISTNGGSETEGSLAQILSLPLEYIRKNNGAWLVNASKPSNFETLSNNQKKSLNEQIETMIERKYQFINYNGLTRNIAEALTNNFTKNIFDDKVVVIDEAHNFISRIVNKINQMYVSKENQRGADISEPIPQHYLFSQSSEKEGSKKKRAAGDNEPKPRFKYVSVALYDYLLNAKNVKIILLTGTPIINYPNEIAILFNILRGYIKTFSVSLDVKTSNAINQETLQQIFANERLLDTVDYTTRKNAKEKQLVITRNPFGFTNVPRSTGVYNGVSTDILRGVVVPGQETDEEFMKHIQRVLQSHDVSFHLNDVRVTYHKAVPDKLYEFSEMFMQSSAEVKNMDKFKRRILGLTSYFRSAQEELMPRYNADYSPIPVEMSDYQFGMYETIRDDEREQEKNSMKKMAKSRTNVSEVFVSPTSTFKIFSRMCCNFAMPPPGRPMPKQIKTQFSDASKEQSGLKEPIREQLVAARIEKQTKEQEKNAKAQEKAQKEREKEAKAQEKAQKEREKEEAKMAKEREKEEAKMAKEREKEEAKMAKEREKEEAKMAKEREKEEAKMAKEREKEEAKRLKELEKAQEKAQEKARKTKKVRSPLSPSSETKKTTNNKTKKKLPVKFKIIEQLPDEELQSGGADSEPANPLDAFIQQLDKTRDQYDMEEELDEETDELMGHVVSAAYKQEVDKMIQYLKDNKYELLSLEGLSVYSPKFLRMIENINSQEHIGNHLVYSQFRTLEGIGIFSIALEANGFAQLKLKRTAFSWELDMSEEDWMKPHYALYTGTEDTEEKEIIRNIYNGDWERIPDTIANVLREKARNNNYGEIIKVFMITASGSEGINLRNTRYVHIMEPYWNPVRTEQVIGRARRICSHTSLPVEHQSVEVFVYLMVFSEAQLARASRSLKLNDVSKADARVVFTTDQMLYEISAIKKRITDQITTAIKEASIDCATHIKGNAKEGLTCISFGNPNAEEISYYPNISNDEEIGQSEQSNVVAKQMLTQKGVQWMSRDIIINGTKYVERLGTNEIYDYESFIQSKENQQKEVPVVGVNPILVGHLVNKNGKTVFSKVNPSVA